MRGAPWVIVDTETDGLRGAVHALELCGQLMEGWEPAGKPFGMRLDHGVPVPPEAVAGFAQSPARRRRRPGPACRRGAVRRGGHEFS